jgi:hypothetical protein
LSLQPQAAASTEELVEAPADAMPLAVSTPDASMSALSMTDVSMSDWGDMLSAVKARLRSVVGDQTVSALQREGLPDEEFQVRCAVLECVAALDQLHATLSHELERRTRMTQELAQAHVTLADARLRRDGPRAEES